ncbi:MAG: hypothetical protein AAGA48_40595 [Myxococcota bacterium]
MQDVTLPWLLPSGEAAGRDAEGRVHKVANAVPGDLVRLEDGGYTVVQPSPDRRAPPCAWSAACGGCDLDALTPLARHAALARMTARAFRVDEPPAVVPSPRTTGHRARIKLALREGRVGYHPPRSHDLVEPERCAIARPEVQQAHQVLREFVREAPTDGLSSVEIRSDGTRAMFSFEGERVSREARAALAELGDVALNGKRIAGEPGLVLSVHAHRLKARPRSFYQVNLEINALLVAHVRDAVRARGAERILDLYAGIGNLSLPLAEDGTPVLAVEWPGPGAADLEENAAGIPNLSTLTCPVERFDPSREAFDAVVLDPPRAGARGVLRKLARNRPRFIVYVSCHAPSAARDIGELKDYRLTELTCFDLFVDTRHIEAVAILERG